MTPKKTHYIDKGQSVSASVLSHAETDQVQCQCGEVTAEESHVNSALADHCSIMLHCQTSAGLSLALPRLPLILLIPGGSVEI